MADVTCIVEDNPNGRVPTDDGTGVDWIIITGTCPATNGAPADGVTGLIENARGGGGTEWIEGNAVANLICGDPLDAAGGNDAL